ncbi:hypothetical protein ACIQBJ_29365 [Kitasatospora sp. NPDC088391]|uniref:hypothetical protein n=1 Tax=Kitasatospora sp. NPDC088391 TaxID=3364074 RepID=UPI0037FC58B0
METNLWAFKVASLLSGITRQEIGLSRLKEGGYRLYWQTTGDLFLETATLPVLSLGTSYGFSSRTQTVWMEVGEYPG